MDLFFAFQQVQCGAAFWGKYRLMNIVKRIWRSLAYRPSGMAGLGDGSVIRWPRRLRGRHSISIGERVVIDTHSWIEAIHGWHAQRFTPRIVIGDDVTIGRHVTLTATSGITIGEGCLLSEGVYMSDSGHDVFSPRGLPLVQMPLVELGEVHIGPRCFIGFRACVLPGVVLGERCIVGAHAVVTRSFPPGSVLVGAPARCVRSLDLGKLDAE